MVRYKTTIDRVNMTFDEISDDREFWSDPTKYEAGKTGSYMRLRLLEKKDSEKLKLAALCAHGLATAPQAPIKVKSGLLDFLKACFTK